MSNLRIISKEPADPVTSASSRLALLASLNCDGRHGLALIAAVAVLLLPLAGGAELAGWLRWSRPGLADGQWWRLAGAHIVHLDARHALLNAAGLALLWALFARSFRPRQWILAVLLIIAAVDAGLWYFSPRVQWYVGASALLHGVFSCGAVAMIRGGERLGWVALVVFAAKIAWEQWQGPLPLSEGPVITDSHLYGAAGGVVAGLLLRPRRERIY
nr:MAG: rhombosortase [Pseudomonadota bacterium]